jgi:hypothetical protein
MMSVPRPGLVDLLDGEVACAFGFPAHAFSGRCAGTARLDGDRSATMKPE